MLDASTSPSSSKPSFLTSTLWPILAGLLSVAFYMLNLERVPHPDELYHMLAARGFIETGEYRIADGIYERGALQTWMSAKMMMWLGDSLAVARLPSVFIMGLVNALLAFWLIRRTSLTVSLIAVTLFAISPFAVETAQLVRFYAPQVLAFLLGTILVFETSRNPKRWWLYVPPALASFYLALDLQPTTVMGLVALCVWLGLILIPAWVAMITNPNNKFRLLGIVIPILAIIAGVALSLSPLGADFWYQYRWVPAFNRHVTDQFYFYHGWFLLYYPVIWPFLGLMCLLAIRARPDIGFLCATLFVMSFLLASFAGTKGLRYFVFAQPFFFTLIGLTLAPWVATIKQGIAQLRHDLADLIPILPQQGRKLLASFLVGLALAFLVVGNGAIVRTITLMAGITVGPEKPDVNWRQALPDLRPRLENAQIFVTMADLETFFYLGDFDLFLVPPGIDDKPDEADFSQDYRTGKTVIGTLDAMQQILACYESGLLLTNVRRWGNPAMSNPDIEEFIEANTQALELPASSRVLAFAWDEPLNIEGASCTDMPEAVRDRSYE